MKTANPEPVHTTITQRKVSKKEWDSFLRFAHARKEQDGTPVWSSFNRVLRMGREQAERAVTD